MSPQDPLVDASDVEGREVNITHSDGGKASPGTQLNLSPSTQTLHKPSSSPNLPSQIRTTRPRETITPASQTATRSAESKFISRIPRGYSQQHGVGITSSSKEPHASEPRSAIPIATHRRSMMNLGASKGTPARGPLGGDRVVEASRTPRPQPSTERVKPSTPTQESARRAPEALRRIDSEPSSDNTIYTGEYRTPLSQRIKRLPHGPILKISSSAEEIIMGPGGSIPDHTVTQSSDPALIRYVDRQLPEPFKESGRQGDTSGSSQTTPVPENNETRVTTPKPVTRHINQQSISLDSTQRCEIIRRKPPLPRRHAGRPPAVDSQATPATRGERPLPPVQISPTAQYKGERPTETGFGMPKVPGKIPQATENETKPLASLKPERAGMFASSTSEVGLHTAESVSTINRLPPRSSSMHAMYELSTHGGADAQNYRSRNTTFDDIVPQGAAESHNGKPQEARTPTPFGNLKPFSIRNIFNKGRDGAERGLLEATSVAEDHTTKTARENKKANVHNEGVKKTLRNRAKSSGINWNLSYPRATKTPLGAILSPTPQLINPWREGANAEAYIKPDDTILSYAMQSQRGHPIVTASSGIHHPASAVSSPGLTTETTHQATSSTGVQTEPPRQDPGQTSHAQFDAIMDATCDMVRHAEVADERDRYLRLALIMQKQLDDLRRSETAVQEATAALNEKVAHKQAVEGAIWARFRQIQAMIDEESEGRS
ncbi:hypothetical protein BO71DRAFT_439380 [Aspergillus ellipticus CBS 707.79]|uniref:Uncharacterized protein n=1 Tax=Aspergillus ellipticus CBS 707.79 TaxID=1448320 RepID=A0A319DHA8_9EURO|nr:hypothetical protein BO71DRAFT_439380 [Aspergillus ellipticus CBS 707.79]